MSKHLYIPDAQIYDGVPLDHIQAAGELIMDERPDVIVIIGDWWDFPSLESFSPATKIAYEHRSYISDYNAGVDALELLLRPMKEYNEHRRRNRKKAYKPRIVFTTGNHEYRVDRVLDQQPNLVGALPLVQDHLKSLGIEVHEFKVPVLIDGVNYCHFCPQELSAGAVGRAHLIASKRHESWTTGHIQIFDYHVSMHTPRLQCLIMGAFYMQDEGYKTGSNDHFRGLAVKRNVRDGEYDPEFISIDSLLQRYN